MENIKIAVTVDQGFEIGEVAQLLSSIGFKVDFIDNKYNAIVGEIYFTKESQLKNLFGVAKTESLAAYEARISKLNKLKTKDE